MTDDIIGAGSVAQSVPLAAASPALYLSDSKAGIALAVHLNGSVINAGSPAVPGEMIVAFGTGFGNIEVSASLRL